MAYPTNHIFYSSGGSSSQEDPFINWLDCVLSPVAVLQTMTTSYGFDEHKVPPDYAMHICNLFAQLGARGTSVLGDDGVSAGNCLFKDGSGNSHVRFLPTFPSTCTCGVFSLCLQAVHKHWYRSLATPSTLFTGP